MKRARIIGTGSYLPEHILTNVDLEKICDTKDEWIRQRTGIEQRHQAAPGQGTSHLALEASRMALDNAGVKPEDLDMVVCCTVTPDMLLPASGNLLQGMLGAKNAGSFDVNAACSGFIAGLSVGRGLIEMGMCQKVLVVGAEIQTNRMTWKNRDTAVLFGDGAGAVVLQADTGDRGVLTTHLGSDGANYEVLYLPRGGSRAPYSVENMDEDAYTIYMKGSELFKRAVVKFVEVSQQALDAAGLTYADIDLFVPHQANARIIEAAGERMGIAREKVVINIYKTGNTTAASIPIALHEANLAGRVKPGNHILFASFGAGLTWGSAIVRW
jgi:3-oxoacyl-[acyl-carrier-protein] synthase-3